MISKIKLKNVATYKEEVAITEINKINFFFGGNGSGKTTISKVIRNDSTYSECAVNYNDAIKPKILVYNEDFVKEYFYADENLKGIYTMGEGAKEIEEKIKEKNEEQRKLLEEIAKLNSTKQQKEDEKKVNFERFKEICWSNIFHIYQETFSAIFRGYRNSKERFATEILNQKNNSSVPRNEENLVKDYRLLFEEDLINIGLINELDENININLSRIETDTILKTKVIGKEDIDIAQMIHKLQNHDWVRQGKEYLEQNFDESTKSYICPFCQQKTTEDFKKKLEEYFDETYENQINNLNNLLNEYEDIKEKIVKYFRDLENIQNKYYEPQKENIKNITQLVEKTLQENIQKIKNKIEKPSIEIELSSLSESLNKIQKIVDDINRNIEKHNKLVADKENQKKLITSEIWKFFYNKIKLQVDQYERSNVDIDKALINIENSYKEKSEKIDSIKREISDLEKQIKSVKPTVIAINNLLDKYGFQGFRLETTKDEKHYRIVRNGGEPAKETLSEGERNFIIFLYFYYLVQGVIDPAENVNESRIIVFDDPVSSLDSDVLFISAILLKSIIKDVREGRGNVKQVFVLTHNAYFFKEVTYISSRESSSKRNDSSYYIVRKINNLSKIEYYETNPIKTTYQLLWDELKKDNIDCVCLQNSMRRILEFYFTILGRVRIDEIIDNFKNSDEKKICRSLIAWVNVGSHEVFEEIDYTPSKNEISKFKKIFKKIFEVTGHIAHYNMMMGIKETTQS